MILLTSLIISIFMLCISATQDSVVRRISCKSQFAMHAVMCVCRSFVDNYLSVFVVGLSPMCFLYHHSSLNLTSSAFKGRPQVALSQVFLNDCSLHGFNVWCTYRFVPYFGFSPCFSAVVMSVFIYVYWVTLYTCCCRFWVSHCQFHFMQHVIVLDLWHTVHPCWHAC